MRFVCEVLEYDGLETEISGADAEKESGLQPPPEGAGRERRG